VPAAAIGYEGKDGNDGADAPEGRNYILNSASLVASGLGSSAGSRKEY
jgi:hypothetical protein